MNFKIHWGPSLQVPPLGLCFGVYPTINVGVAPDDTNSISPTMQVALSARVCMDVPSLIPTSNGPGWHPTFWGGVGGEMTFALPLFARRIRLGVGTEYSLSAADGNMLRGALVMGFDGMAPVKLLTRIRLEASLIATSPHGFTPLAPDVSITPAMIVSLRW